MTTPLEAARVLTDLVNDRGIPLEPEDRDEVLGVIGMLYEYADAE